MLTVKAAAFFEKSEFHSSNYYIVLAGDSLLQTCEGRNEKHGHGILGDGIFVAATKIEDRVHIFNVKIIGQQECPLSYFI